MTVFRGDFYDGKSAARHEVWVEVKSYGLEIVGDGAKLLATWPLEELEAAEMGQLLSEQELGGTLMTERRGQLP